MEFTLSYTNRNFRCLELGISLSEKEWKRMPFVKEEWLRKFKKLRSNFDYHTRFRHYEEQHDLVFQLTQYGIKKPQVLGRFYADWTKVADQPTRYVLNWHRTAVRWRKWLLQRKCVECDRFVIFTQECPECGATYCRKHRNSTCSFCAWWDDEAQSI